MLRKHRDAGEVLFEARAGDEAGARLFVGREWTPGMTQGAAELYARLGGLAGQVRRLEGSFPTLHMFEIVA